MSGPIASFRVPKDYKPLIDRSKILGPDGKVDYSLLIMEINDLGRRLYEQEKIIKHLM